MARSITSVLHATDEFQDALCDLGDIQVVTTEPGRLEVRMTHLRLEHLRVVTVRENLPRIASIRIPDNTVLLWFLLGGQTMPVWAGLKIPVDGLMVVCGGESLHMRTDSATHWCAILYPLGTFMRFRRAVSGQTSKLPGAVCAWQSPPHALAALLQLVRGAARAAQTQSVALITDQAVHGLEQQLIHCTLKCLMGKPLVVETASARHQRELANRFEALLQSQGEGKLRVSDLTEALDVSDRALRRCIELHLGLSPMRYLRLRRMQWPCHRVRSSSSQTLRGSDVSERFGFRCPSRFVKAYRVQLGELPSGTLRGDGQCGRRARSSDERFRKASAIR